jgi:hypothetical protein
MNRDDLTKERFLKLTLVTDPVKNKLKGEKLFTLSISFF